MFALDAADSAPISGRDEDAFLDAFMGQREYPRFDYGVEDVKRVGAVIAGDLHWTPETEARIREAFQIANNWRDAHAFPMRSVRGSLRWYMYHHDVAGVTAARLKRM